MTSALARAKWRFVVGIPLAVGLMADCSGDASKSTAPRGQKAFDRYVVVGTGLSMGVISGGVVRETQVQSWPALLAHAAGASIAQPLLAAPGCNPPLVAPLRFGRTLRGVVAPDTGCGGLFSGLALPSTGAGYLQVALAGATARDALRLTAQSARAGANQRNRQLYPLVLRPTETQVIAMRVRRPTLVSVELGLDEVLDAARAGVAIAAASYAERDTSSIGRYIPAALWLEEYTQIVDSVRATRAPALLVTVPDVTRLPAFWPGSALYADRTGAAGFGITVSADCAGSDNLVFVPTRVVRAYVAAGGAGLTVSCANVPGASDAVLTPDEAATLQGEVHAMNDAITTFATTRGWALLNASTVVDAMIAAEPAPTFANLLTCTEPFGRLTSLDGVYPSADGQQQLAAAAAAALDSRYGFGLSRIIPPAPATACP